MPGLLSNMFGGGDDASQSDQQLGAGDEFDIDQPVGVETSESGSYQTPDGTTHEWSHSSELDATVSTHAAIGIAADAGSGIAHGDDAL